MAKRKKEKRPPKSKDEAALRAGQGAPWMDLPDQVRSQVNTTTIDTLSGLARDETDDETRRRRRNRRNRRK